MASFQTQYDLTSADLMMLKKAVMKYMADCETDGCLEELLLKIDHLSEESQENRYKLNQLEGTCKTLQCERRFLLKRSDLFKYKFEDIQFKYDQLANELELLNTARKEIEYLRTAFRNACKKVEANSHHIELIADYCQQQTKSIVPISNSVPEVSTMYKSQASDDGEVPVALPSSGENAGKLYQSLKDYSLKKHVFGNGSEERKPYAKNDCVTRITSKGFHPRKFCRTRFS